MAGLVAMATPAMAQKTPPAMQEPSTGLGIPMEEIGLDVEERVGLTLPLELQFTNADGRLVPLSSYFPGDGRPVVMQLVYYRCPVACPVLMDKLSETLHAVDYTIGKDFRVVVVSFDPNESAQAARGVQDAAIASYVKNSTGRGEAGALEATVASGWHFHVADPVSARGIADALGFRYKKLANGEYSHPIVTFIMTPEGKVSRYLYGFKQEPRDMKLALMEASEGKLVRTLGERFLNFCYMYDPTRKGYALQAIRVVQVGGMLTLVIVAGFIGIMLLGERMRKRRRGAAPAPHATHAPTT
jgi:protein SCO1/2